MTGPIANAASGEPPAAQRAASQRPELREVFQQFVGETFFGQLLEAMHKTHDKPAYLHGGRTEDVFQGQLNQALAERISQSSGDRFAGPMFDLFMLQRR